MSEGGWGKSDLDGIWDGVGVRVCSRVSWMGKRKRNMVVCVFWGV